MKKLITILVVIAVVLIIFLLLGPFYVVEEGEQAVVTRFGRIVQVNTTAGLKFKTPMIDNVIKYPKKILAWDGDPQRVPTSEKQFIWVDTTARWKIEDPQKFYESVTTLQQGFGRLDEVIDSTIRTVIVKYPLREVVRNSNIIKEIEVEEVYVQAEVELEEEEEGLDALRKLTETRATYEDVSYGRVKLSGEIQTIVKKLTPQFGITLVDIIIRQIRYSEDLTESVYERMIKERNQIAEAFRSFGAGKKQEWLGRLENDKKAILSKAFEEGEKIRGEADATATKIYNEAYEADPEFFRFWRSIRSYRKTLPTFRKILTTDMEYFDYLYSERGGR